jgi:hypothetical protein
MDIREISNADVDKIIGSHGTSLSIVLQSALVESNRISFVENDVIGI